MDVVELLTTIVAVSWPFVGLAALGLTANKRKI